MLIKWDGAKQRRTNLNMRCTDDLRARVEAAAKASGRSLTDEVLWRVECSLRDDAARQHIEDSVGRGVMNALMLLREREEQREIAGSSAPAAEPISSPLPSYAQ